MGKRSVTKGLDVMMTGYRSGEKASEVLEAPRFMPAMLAMADTLLLL